MMVRRVTHSEQTGDVIGADRQGQLGQGPPSVPYCTLKDTTPRPTACADSRAKGSRFKTTTTQTSSDRIEQSSTNRLERVTRSCELGG
ncbi:hypothetical protein QQF64_023072 [Cirrhinus molitorella]|uniref:Uncharacterized protein n=1 Tax=Cirrhinus molitorella TaxID=172907 RepID=A0ABR3L6G1_9TELE